MEKYVENIGIWSITAIVAVVVIAYAYFASYELHASAQALSQAPAKALTANLK